ncbi:hypothetical protein GCM10025876_21950 [Demequina litorisediminis]|uniref:Uncharacterized protein n=1 Tax=Demequina litorisediminis TaxID=1849022 RepID=A0ABQ6IEX1_9MICO|nr:hypothetical protein GCM10025876_21950 [Demequina litorisediminis]
MSLTTNTAAAAVTAAQANETEKRAPKISRNPFAGRSGTEENKAVNWTLFGILSLGAVFMAAPLLWMLSTSLKTKEAVYSLPPQWIPDPFVWDNYVRVFDDTYVLSGIKNSLIVAGTVTIIGTVFSALAAFALAKPAPAGKERHLHRAAQRHDGAVPHADDSPVRAVLEPGLGGHAAAPDRPRDPGQRHHDLLPAPVPAQRA